jgi:hypothetical protein
MCPSLTTLPIGYFISNGWAARAVSQLLMLAVGVTLVELR